MHHRVTRIERELDEIKAENDIIKYDVEKLKDKFIDHTPEHFSQQDILRAFIGALFLGFSVFFSGNLFKIAFGIPIGHIYLIIIATLVVLTAEIYFIGYSRVVNKKDRGFIQFLIKRLFAFYAIAFLVALSLSFVFGIQYLTSTIEEFMRIVVIVSSPCAIGASITDLLKKY